MTRAQKILKQWENIQDDLDDTGHEHGNDGNREKVTRLNRDKAENNRANDLTSISNGYRPSLSR